MPVSRDCGRVAVAKQGQLGQIWHGGDALLDSSQHRLDANFSLLLRCGAMGLFLAGATASVPDVTLPAKSPLLDSLLSNASRAGGRAGVSL